ncbi:MAG: hypothetical protein KGI60_04210 [Patescibacteria group bacterium]|nr:hypothetical protein [Patescibacteria group bacterium]
MKAFLARHGFIFVLAAIIGGFIIAPTVLAILRMDGGFRGVYPMFSNDEDQYLAMTQEVADGHFNLGSPYLSEHKDEPYLQPPAAEIIFAETAGALHISVPELFALNDFALPFCGVILLYFLLYEVVESPMVAAFFAVLYYALLIGPFNRPINPQFSFLFLFGGVLVSWEILKERIGSFRKMIAWNFLLAVIFGVAFYIYPFVWTSIVAVYGVTAFLLAVKERSWMYYLQNMFFFAVPAFLFSMPFLWNLKSAMANPNYVAENLRFGFLFTHWPAAYLNVAIMAACLVLMYLVSGIAADKKGAFGYSLALSGVILNWQNVITGRAFSFSMHYYWVVILFACIVFAIAAVSIVSDFKKRSVTYRGWAALALAVIVLLGILYRQSGDIAFGFGGFVNQSPTGTFESQQQFADVADWLNAHTSRDASIYSLGGNYTQLIPVYTHDNDFYNANAGLFLISDDELENRWVIQNFFRSDITAAYVEDHSVEIWANKFIERYQNQVIRNKIISLITGVQQPAVELVPQEYIDRVLAKVQAYQKLGFEKAIREYPVDYIVLDTGDPEYGSLADAFRHMPSLHLAATPGNNLIFSVVK